MHKMKYFANLIDSFSEYIGKIASFLMIPMFLTIMWEVISRYAFNKPTIWVHEASVFIMAGVCLLGAAWTLERRYHVTIDIFYRRLSSKRQAAFDLATSIIFFLFFGVLSWVGIDYFLFSLNRLENSNSVWAPPLYPVKFLIPLAAVLMSLQGIAMVIHNISVLTSKEDLNEH